MRTSKVTEKESSKTSCRNGGVKRHGNLQFTNQRPQNSVILFYYNAIMIYYQLSNIGFVTYEIPMDISLILMR